MDIWRYGYIEIYGSRGHLQDILLVLHMVDLLEADDVVEAENLDFLFGQTNYYYSLLSFIAKLLFIVHLFWKSQLLLFIEAT